MNTTQRSEAAPPTHRGLVRCALLGALGHVLVATVLTATCALAAPASVEPGTALETVYGFVELFNQHDADRMAARVTSDFELYYFDPAGVAGLATRGPDQLREEMRAYFAARPTVRSEIVDAVDGPAFVSFRERIVSGHSVGRSSLAVYEVRGGLIRRAWYYPAE